MCEHILRDIPHSNEPILRNDQKRSVLIELTSKSDTELFRSLTPGEIKLAKSVFQNAINYDRVKIYCGSNQSRSQSKAITNTQNGEVLLSINEYRTDFSAGYTSYRDSVKYPHLFIFAMTFVWQYYRHDSSFHDSTYASSCWCTYDFDKPYFIFYTMEQQAAIVADYWVLNQYDLTEYEDLSGYQKYEKFKINMRMELLGKYESILSMHIII